MSDLKLSKFVMQDTSMPLAPSTEGQETILAMLKTQIDVLTQINNVTKETEKSISERLEQFKKNREEIFERSMKIVQEMERLGMIDLALESPILGKVSSI